MLIIRETPPLERYNVKGNSVNKILPPLFSTLHQFSSVHRFSRDHMTKRESVLEHVGFCGLFAYFVGKMVENSIKGEVIEVRYDELLIKALIHDADEPVLGDVPRVTKYYNQEIRDAFSTVEEQSVQGLCDYIKVDFFNEWKHAKSYDLEGIIIKITDMAAVVYKTWNEVVLLNNLSFLRIAEEMDDLKLIPKLMITINELKKDSRIGSASSKLLEILREMDEIVKLILSKHHELLKDDRNMLFGFPILTKNEGNV